MVRRGKSTTYLEVIRRRVAALLKGVVMRGRTAVFPRTLGRMCPSEEKLKHLLDVVERMKGEVNEG